MALHATNEISSNKAGAGNGRSDNDAPRTERESSSCLLGCRDVALCDDRHMDLIDHAGQKGPAKATILAGLLSIAIERGSNEVGSCFCRCKRLLQSGNIGHYRQVKIAVNSLD